MHGAGISHLNVNKSHIVRKTMKPSWNESVKYPKHLNMADLHKIQRSKDLIARALNYLKSTSKKDVETTSFINDLQLSMQVIDNKMEKFKRKNAENNSF